MKIKAKESRSRGRNNVYRKHGDGVQITWATVEKSFDIAAYAFDGKQVRKPITYIFAEGAGHD